MSGFWQFADEHTFALVVIILVVFQGTIYLVRAIKAPGTCTCADVVGGEGEDDEGDDDDGIHRS